jgi:hypothetical protein
MPRPRDAVPFVFALALVLNGTAAWAGEAKAVKIERSWRGEFRTKNDAALAPKSCAITTAKEWQKLWKGWRGDAKLPKIDFTKELVIVAVESEIDAISLELTDDGDLQIEEEGGLVENDYIIAVVKRAGIESVHGQRIRKGKN